MSTTRSQKRRNDQQSTSENVSEGLISPVAVGNPCSLNQDDEVAGPSRPKSPRIENSLFESLRTSLKEEITSEFKNLLIESQKEMLKLLKPETRGIIRENTEEEVEEETRIFYTPTKSVRISSTQNDPIACRNSNCQLQLFILLMFSSRVILVYLGCVTCYAQSSFSFQYRRVLVFYLPVRKCDILFLFVIFLRSGISRSALIGAI